MRCKWIWNWFGEKKFGRRVNFEDSIGSEFLGCRAGINGHFGDEVEFQILMGNQRFVCLLLPGAEFWFVLVFDFWFFNYFLSHLGWVT